MPAGPQQIPILTYHSISEAAGPTSTGPDIFRQQMDAVRDAGWSVVSLDAFAQWRLKNRALPERSLVITFDDGFDDFAHSAFPVLDSHGFGATVFVPTALMGGLEVWEGANAPARKLMSWQTIEALSSRGISFQPHGRTHADLSSLDREQLELEIAGSGRELAERTGVSSKHFAPPYGRTCPAAQAHIAEAYEISVGVELGIADHKADPLHAPRIEMFYYRDPQRWKQFLAGDGAGYLLARKAARSLRRLVSSVGPGNRG